MYKLYESVIGSLGILIFGFITIPFAASVSGAQVSQVAAIKMSLLFFVGRIIWLYILRLSFDKATRCKYH